TQCSSRNHFGSNCDFECHCLNGEQCNSSTGNCPSGCEFDWVGPGCQRSNIVPAGQTNEREIVTRHQSNIPQRRIASLAVDRDLSTCSQTNYANMSKDIPWWRLWLKDKYKIRNISIVTTKVSLDYFKNFKVTVGNSTFQNRYNGVYSGRKICYRHDDTAPRTTTISVTCNRAIYGNQIKIRLATNGTQLVLCDVRIYGECDDGTFGVSCTDRCSTHCQDVCDKNNGACTSCKSGWTGNRCNQACKSGYHGMECKKKCSAFCLRKGPSYCSHINGRCFHGCQAGWQGAHCNRTCVNGRYGRNCVLTCSGNCRNNSICSNVDGGCEQGCKTGYTGNRCNKSCGTGYYGDKCAQRCSDNCFKNTCNSGNGNCFHGCKPGWVGLQCDQELLKEPPPPELQQPLLPPQLLQPDYVKYPEDHMGLDDEDEELKPGSELEAM
ncbi:scavenger receptor class F member 2-like, partial [Mercenaria mercenaria]|uniref:scavenger receptor class F member 2-like n=1 Tax=Mercenaria mercenaria TaxID=6596 RepID=UPI00234EB924